MCAAINIPDMVNIVHAHGLVPVPIDLDFDMLSPDLAQFQAAVEDERSVCAVIAHVFGCVVDMAPYARACSRRPGFLLVEDAAEAFCPELMQAPLLSSVRLYSFGPIKVCTSWTGAVAVVQDDELRAALLRQLSTYPLQSRWSHLLRVLKFLVLVLLQHPKVFYCLVKVLKAVGLNHAAVLQPLVKSFSAKQSLLDNIRKQPCQAASKTLAQRISTLDNDMLKQSRTRAQCVGPQLPASCRVPGSKAPLHTYWLFPVVIEDTVLRERVCDRFRDSTMFDVGTKPSQLCVIAAPEWSGFAQPKIAQLIMSNCIFLPCRRGVPPSICDLLAKTIAQADLRPY
jgi:dTDP-4-amino-4,6-dideoxygalactose transaminase